jgi:mono/diheme cytochrome c family protein
VRLLHYLASCSLILCLGAKGESDSDFFEDKVLPILKANCYKCHSHEAGKIKGGLALDSRSGWQEGGERGPAVVPGKPEESLLLEGIRHTDSDFKMPPKKKLADEEIAILTDWVTRGAPDPRTTVPEKDLTELTRNWWSLVPLKRPPLPSTASPAPNPIDAFVQARLRKDNLSPAPPADRRTLIRRLSFNLHGLPPTPDQVKLFVADKDPSAYRNLVNQLLDSPRYGERWARHWLDTIHFADSHGCEHDILRPHAWPFRDYVIQRLNEDVPWDHFIREQLAPEIFYPAQSHLRAGLGFLSAGPLELSRAGTAPVTFDYLDRDDIVTQTMSAFVSTTANCARCHTHKFDPVSQADYYSLQAVFAGVGKGDLEFELDPKSSARRTELLAKKEAIASQDATVLLDPKYSSIVQAFLRTHRENPAVWQPLGEVAVHSTGGTAWRRLADGSFLASGPRPETDTYRVTGSTALKSLSGIRLDVLADKSLPMNGPGRQDNGNLHLSEFEAQLIDPGAREPTTLKFTRATADWNQVDWTISHALDSNAKSAWGIFPKVGQSHHAVFELEHSLPLEPGTRIVVNLKQLHGGGHLLGRFKLSLTEAPGAVADLLPEHVRNALNTEAQGRSEAQQVAIAAYVLEFHADRELKTLPAKSVVYGVSKNYSHGKKLDRPQATPKIVHLLHRGDIKKPGAVAQPGALAALKALPGRFALPHPEQEETRRAALADWIASPDNPLTWRSIVNRVWHYHFGRGLCHTPNDFGRMGGTPSHPELIDWLAHWFRDDAKGSLKELHRLILNSETYRQSFRHNDLRAPNLDAQNLLLWRMNSTRLDAESFRDSLLQISGRLDLTMGGPGVEQFTSSKGQQDTPNLDYQAYDWSQPGAARRSIYRVVWRGIADPFMEALDFPDMALLAPKRGASVSALQSLTLYNNEFVLHHSKQLATRLQNESSSLEDQVRHAVELIYLRAPTPSEHQDLTSYAQQFGLSALARVLFNSNEFLFID